MECHDSDGRGTDSRDTFPRIPDFTDSRWQTSRTDADLSHSILEGKGKSMPAMKTKLGPVDVKQMVAFIRAFKGGKQVVDDEPAASESPSIEAGAASGPVTVKPSFSAPLSSSRTDSNFQEGSRQFQRFCAKCHGAGGKGTEIRSSLPALPNLADAGWQTSRSDVQLAVTVLDGKGDGMPPFRDKLSREQIRSVVAFIRTFVPSGARTTSGSANAFEAQFQRLVEEMEDLRRQARALSDSHP
jgi:mono/diheme cytochrome c family protein